MKELRHAREASWYDYSELKGIVSREGRERALDADAIKRVPGDFERGMFAQGWLYQGFIEDRNGHLRPQSQEETLFCMGCHGGVAATSDSVFSFPRRDLHRRGEPPATVVMATSEISPRPIASASAAATRRRRRSSGTGASNSNRFPRALLGVRQSAFEVRLDAAQCRDPAGESVDAYVRAVKMPRRVRHPGPVGDCVLSAVRGITPDVVGTSAGGMNTLLLRSLAYPQVTRQGTRSAVYGASVSRLAAAERDYKTGCTRKGHKAFRADRYLTHCLNGGEGGIRTHGTHKSSLDFESDTPARCTGPVGRFPMDGTKTGTTAAPFTLDFL